MNFSQRLINLREEKGWSKTDAAKKIGVSTGAYANWEYGNREPTRKMFKKLEKIFDVPESYLITGSLDDFAEYLITKLEKDLINEGKFNKGVIELIINDINSRMFPKLLPRGAKDAESLKKEFEEYKKDALETWTNYDNLDYEIVSRIQYALSSDISDNLKYFYSDFYESDDNRLKSDKRITNKSADLVKRLEQLDRFQRSYIEGLRHLENKEVIAELDKIEDYTNEIDNKTGVIKL